MSEVKPDPVVDPVIDGTVDLLMLHYANEHGAVDYPRAAAAFAQILAEMIGPQPIPIRAQMLMEFQKELDRAVQLAALRASVIPGGKVQ